MDIMYYDFTIQFCSIITQLYSQAVGNENRFLQLVHNNNNNTRQAFGV